MPLSLPDRSSVAHYWMAANYPPPTTVAPLQQVQQREISARTVLEGLHAAQRKFEDINGDLKVSQEIDRLLPSLKKQIAAAIEQVQTEQRRLAALIEKQTGAEVDHAAH